MDCLAEDVLPALEQQGREACRKRSTHPGASVHSAGGDPCLQARATVKKVTEPAQKNVELEVTRRPNIVPDRFSGKTPWRDYKQHFEACRLANNWTDNQAKVFLAASLQGSAVKVLGNLTRGGNHVTYQELVSFLEKRFGPGQLAENHLMELRHRRQGQRETLQGLGQFVRELTALAYPELTEEGRDRLARGLFSIL